MSYIEIAVRLLLLAISCYGYVLCLSKHMHIAFSLGWLCAFIGSVMFLAGMLNMMMAAAWLIFVCGLLLFLFFIIRKREKFLVSAELVFFGVLAGYFLVLLHGSKFENIDNFTHWVIAARALILTDAFPNTETINYLFTSYPLGSAAFVYYVAEIIGIQPEWLQMWAQAIIMAAMISGLFGFRGSKQSILAAAGSALILLCSSINFVDLLVDTLLPVTAVGAMSFCIYYRKELENKQIFLLPYTIFLLSIKNSGIFFAVFIFVYVFASMNKTPGAIRRWGIVLVSSVAVICFWKLHVGYVFRNADTTDLMSLHNMSLSGYQETFLGKTIEENLAVLKLFGKQTFADSRLIVTLLFLGAGIYISALRNQSEHLREIKKLLLFIAVSYAVYQIGMLAMYLFSMEQYEAQYLAGYDRYHPTILIFCTGILTIVLMLGMQKKQYKPCCVLKTYMAVCVYLAMICFVMQPHFQYYLKQNPEGSQELRDREKMEFLMEEYQIEQYRTYAVIISEDRIDKTKEGYQQLLEVGYLKYMLQYELDSDHVKITYGPDLGVSDIEGYDYVILYDETEEGRALLNEMFGEREKSVICTFEM